MMGTPSPRTMSPSSFAPFCVMRLANPHPWRLSQRTHCDSCSVPRFLAGLATLDGGLDAVLVHPLQHQAGTLAIGEAHVRVTYRPAPVSVVRQVPDAAQDLAQPALLVHGQVGGAAVLPGKDRLLAQHAGHAPSHHSVSDSLWFAPAHNAIWLKYRCLGLVRGFRTLDVSPGMATCGRNSWYSDLLYCWTAARSSAISGVNSTRSTGSLWFSPNRAVPITLATKAPLVLAHEPP